MHSHIEDGAWHSTKKHRPPIPPEYKVNDHPESQLQISHCWMRPSASTFLATLRLFQADDRAHHCSTVPLSVVDEFLRNACCASIQTASARGITLRSEDAPDFPPLAFPTATRPLSHSPLLVTMLVIPLIPIVRSVRHVANRKRRRYYVIPKLHAQALIIELRLTCFRFAGAYVSSSAAFRPNGLILSRANPPGRSESSAPIN